MTTWFLELNFDLPQQEKYSQSVSKMASNNKPTTRALLLALPTEIQQKIFSYALSHPHREVNLSRTHTKRIVAPESPTLATLTALTGVCRQFDREADKRCFYRNNHFQTDDIPALKAFITDTRPFYLGQIEDLSISLFRDPDTIYDDCIHLYPKALQPVYRPKFDPLQPRNKELLRPFHNLRTLQFTDKSISEKHMPPTLLVAGEHPSRNFMNGLVGCFGDLEHLQVIMVQSFVTRPTFALVYYNEVVQEYIPRWRGWAYSLENYERVSRLYKIWETIRRMFKPYEKPLW